MNDRKLLTTQLRLNNVAYLSWVEIRNECRPSRADALTSVDQNHRDNRDVEFRFDDLTVIFYIGEGVVVRFREEHTRDSVQICENVSCRGMVLAT